MKKFSPAQVGQRIRLIRGKTTQTDFAKILGVYKQNYISRYERGRVPSPNLLIKIANLGKVTLDWLLTGEGNPPVLKATPKKAAKPAKKTVKKTTKTSKKTKKTAPKAKKKTRRR